MRRWLALLFVGLTACQGLLDIDNINFSDEDDGKSASNAGGAGGSGGEGGATSVTVSVSTGMLPDCRNPDQEVCLAPVPAGWLGPSGAQSFVTMPGRECLDGGGLEGILAADLNTGTHACSPCSCGADAGDCAPRNTSVYAGFGCGSGATTLPFTSSGLDSCYNMMTTPDVTTAEHQGNMSTAPCLVTGGGEPQLSDPFGDVIALCTLSLPRTGDPCGDGFCVPRPLASLCIYAPGEQSCPPGWPLGEVAYESYDDQRDCTACDCAPDDLICETTTEFFLDFDCMNSDGSATGEGCETVSAPNVHSAIQTAAIDGTCSPTGGVPEGSVEGIGPVTVCCLAD